MKSTKLGLTALACALFTVEHARADVLDRKHDEAGDYYSFTDDLVHSDVLNGAAPRIVLRLGHPRTGLLRPRASFVVELLKSVEAL